ncbi:hypothetical protein N0V88_002436 [Collariella sp. IMI 366227]|nr:hypothetical protein N0V88_002436 [Collariella sp. IMI 366227]
MAFPVSAIVGVAVVLAIYAYVSGLRKNIAKARKTGFVYIVLPWSPFNLVWQLTFWIWVPLIKKLPKSLWENRLFVMLPEWGYATGQEYFNRLGSETFIVAFPSGLILFTQSPEVIHKMTQRREAFPKNVVQYDILRQFGDNVLTTEGPLWRLHRKVTSASFNEQNAAHTFAEAITQTQGMLDFWFGPDGEKAGTTKTIKTLEHDTMTWALNIIGYVGFGLRLLWPGQTLPADMDPKLAKYGSLDPPPGHSMTFKPGMDIMGQLAQSAYSPKASKDAGCKLSDSNIIGNAFIMIVAGHETTANTLHFALLELATNPSTQRRLQHDIDALLGPSSDPATWNYERVISPLLASHVGASVYETLRLMPPVTGIPKVVAKNDQGIVRYSIELAVDKWAIDKEVEAMGREERREVYAKAQKESRETMRQADSVLTLKLHGGSMCL